MIEQKRKRGRPQGSGKDDTALLNKVADALICDPKSSPTSVMTRLVHNHHEKGESSKESHVRRLQVKWRVQKEKLLAEAQARRDASERQRTAPSGNAGYVPPSYATHMLQRELGAATSFLDRAMRATELNGLGDPFISAVLGRNPFPDAAAAAGLAGNVAARAAAVSPPRLATSILEQQSLAAAMATATPSWMRDPLYGVDGPLGFMQSSAYENAVRGIDEYQRMMDRADPFRRLRGY